MARQSGDPSYRIQLFGAPAITTPECRLLASRTVVFGAALYLIVNRGRTVRRAGLAALLWPDVEDETRGERLRWLVHQLRAAGFPAPIRSPEIGVAHSDVVTDLDALAEATSADEVLRLTHGAILAGYEPAISDLFDRWLEDTRDQLRSQAVRLLATWLRSSRRAGAWNAVEELARRVLSLDALHEGASLALAEARAIQGHRAGSVERAACEPPVMPQRGALIGRTGALAHLLEGLDPDGIRCRQIGIAGAAGIGKSRLLDEFSLVAELRGAQVVRLRCAHGDALRPLSLAVDLARALLDARGALGASPESIEVLRRFVGSPTSADPLQPNEARRAAVYAALSEVAAALTDEGPLAVAIDDVHWAEPGSWAILAPLFAQSRVAPLLGVFAARAETPAGARAIFTTVLPPDHAESEQARDVVWLDPLDRADVEALCVERAAPRVVPLDVLDRMIPRAAGIPFIAESLVSHWADGGDVCVLPPSVARLVRARLDRLSADARRVLVAVAVLGPDATLPAVEAVSHVQRPVLLEAADALDTAGILTAADGILLAHALWTDAAVARTPRTTLNILHRSAAEWLEHQTLTQDPAEPRRHWAVATHWMEAGDPSRAHRALNSAADALSANGFTPEASETLQRAADLAGTSDVGARYRHRAAELRSDA